MTIDPKANGPSKEEVDAVHEISVRLLAAALESPGPGVALNALLTAYINCASHFGMLDQIPGAAAALSHASQQMLAVQRNTSHVPAGTPIH